MNPSSFSGPGEYQIVVQGHLDDQLSYWFEGLTVRTGYGEEGTPITTLSARFVDQAALHGGSGMPSSPWTTWNGYFAGLEERFVLVHWDQQGCARSDHPSDQIVL